MVCRIRTSLQEADGRQRAASMQPPVSLAHTLSEPPYAMVDSPYAIGSGLAYSPSPDSVPFMSQSTYASPSDRRYASTQLHAIDESTELTDSAIAQETRPGKMRKNLMSGFRRVAKAVKTAAKSDSARKLSVDRVGYTVGGESISHPHMLETTGSLQPRQYGVYSGEGRRVVSVVDEVTPALVQPGPRQRSLTQQPPPRAPPFVVAGRTPQQQQQQKRVRSHHGGLLRVRTSSSLASMDHMSSASSLASYSPQQTEAGVRRMSPLGQSPHLSGSGSSDKGSASCEFPGLKPGQGAPTPYTARSADPIPVATSPQTARSADPIPVQHSIYPSRRDRSMTLPGNQQTSSAGPMRLRRKASVPHCGNPELERLARGIATTAASAGPGKLDLPISQSPLLEPSTQESIGHSAGARIQRQAVRNLSAGTVPELPLSDDLLMLPLLPSPASNHHASSSHELMEHTPLSRLVPVTDGRGLLPLCQEPEDGGVGLSTGVPDARGSTDRLRHYLDPGRVDAGYGASANITRTAAASVDERQLGARAALKYANDSGVQVNDERLSASSEMLRGHARGGTHISLPIIDTSPPTPFSFGHHSRYSLINHDGSLNLTSFQFEQLDGYQKRLSGSPPPLSSSRTEGRLLGDRFMRKAPAENGGGWLWSADEPTRQRRLMRKPRKQTNDTVAAPSLGSVHSRSVSVSTTHSVVHARASNSHSRNSHSSNSSNSNSVVSRRASQHSGLPDAFRRPSDNASIGSGMRVPGRWPRLMHMAPESSVPFDSVYRSSIAALSMEQALTLVEGSARAISSKQQPGRRRRMHKRSTSALAAGELDDIMIQTAEMCHSVQTAIRMQHGSESGLARWISSVVGKPEPCGPELSACASESREMDPEPSYLPNGPADTLGTDRGQFFSADCSPNVHGPFVSSESSVDTRKSSVDTREPCSSASHGSHVSLNLWTSNAADSYKQSGASSEEYEPVQDGRGVGLAKSYASSVCSDSSPEESFVVHDPIATVPTSSPRNLSHCP
ncbi:hypothetical protein IW148_003452 [Coemansia sp. RSA 1199]|nr:hypothetical protein IW148_003452 [Coemansia sp. RSA 1199]